MEGIILLREDWEEWHPVLEVDLSCDTVLEGVRSVCLAAAEPDALLSFSVPLLLPLEGFLMPSFAALQGFSALVLITLEGFLVPFLVPPFEDLEAQAFSVALGSSGTLGFSVHLNFSVHFSLAGAFGFTVPVVWPDNSTCTSFSDEVNPTGEPLEGVLLLLLLVLGAA